MSEKLRNVPIPANLDEALRVAKSLANWIEWIKANGSMSSNGGWVELHLSALNVWNQQEKIAASAKALQDSLTELEQSFVPKESEKE